MEHLILRPDFNLNTRVRPAGCTPLELWPERYPSLVGGAAPVEAVDQLNFETRRCVLQALLLEKAEAARQFGQPAAAMFWTLQDEAVALGLIGSRAPLLDTLV